MRQAIFDVLRPHRTKDRGQKTKDKYVY
jgi:hypothetical protein